MTELRKCPFCGGEAKVTLILGHYTVACTNCMACILGSPYEMDREPDTAIEAWNKRVSCNTCAMYFPDDGCMAGLTDDEVAE